MGVVPFFRQNTHKRNKLKLALHVVGEVVEHGGFGGLVGEDEAAFEGGIETAMVFVREEDQVLCAVVDRVAVEVVAFEDASVLVHGPRAMESGAHKDVTQLCSIMSHKFVPCPSAGFTRRGIGAIAGLEFFTFFVEKPPIGTAKKDFASCQFERNLLGAWIKTRVIRSTAAQ